MNPAGRDPLLRLLGLARPWRGQLMLAVAAGAAATGCGVALLAVSGFLLARASQHPNIIAISAAVVAVRALSAGRGVSRYFERLAAHDAAFRILADVRVSIYRRLERLAPAGLSAFGSGDLLARLISDVDATQDLFIRGITPPCAAALVGAGSVVVCLLILAPAGAVLAAGLLAVGIGVPLLAARAARGAAGRAAPARGRLAADLTDLLAGAAELHAYGAQEQALAAVTAADAELTRQARRHAAVSGLGAGLGSAIAGLTLWGVLLLGVAATGDGALTRVPLAVLTLTALASFEAVTALPAAAIQLGQARPGRPRRDGPRPAAGAANRPDRPERRGKVHGRQRPVPVRRPDRGYRHAQRARPGQLRGGRRPGQDQRLPARSAHLQRVAAGQPEARQARRHRRGTRRRGRPGRAARLDPVAAARLGHAGRRGRVSPVGRPAPAAGPGPGAARRPSGADPRRAHRPPGPRQPPRPDQGPARRDGRARDAAHHSRPRWPGPGRRGDRAEGRGQIS
jgi:hypothetical protein